MFEHLKRENPEEFKEPQFIVVCDVVNKGEDIYYYGTSEFEARRHYKRAKESKEGKVNIYWAYVNTVYVLDYLFIDSYEILEVIK